MIDPVQHDAEATALALQLTRKGALTLSPEQRAQSLRDAGRAVRRANARAKLKPPKTPPATLARALPGPLVYSLAMASQALNLSDPYLRQQVRKGALKCHYAGTRVLFFRQDLVDFINALPTN